MDENYSFNLPTEFSHYISSRDKTNVAPNTLVKNSKNVYKKRSGNWANRPGLKKRGVLNATQAGVVASYEWESSFGVTKPIRVTADGVLSVEYDANDGQGPLWYNLLTGLTLTRWIFDSSYFDTLQFKEILLACNGGNNYIWNWEGGVAQTLSAGGGLVAGVITQGYAQGYIVTGAGTGYAVGDIVTLVGGDGTAKVRITAIGGSGVPTAFGFMVPQGTGYSAGVVPTTGGSGTGLTINILSVYSAGSITKTGSSTFFQDGFSKAYTTQAGGGLNPNTLQWKFIYNGVIYSYGGGLDSTTLTGVTPDPSGIPAGAVIMSPFIEVDSKPVSSVSFANSQLANFTCDFLKVINNQLYIGSYGNRLICVSEASDYTNFDDHATNPGDSFFFSVPGNPVGISFIQNETNNNQIPIVFHGTSSYDIINISSQVVPQGTTNPAITVLLVGQITVKFNSNSAPLAQEFIDNNGPYVVWLGQEHQVHILGATKDLFLSNKAPLLSQPVYDELAAIDFTGGALRIMDEYIYITAPLISTHYVYQEREFVDVGGAIQTEKIWNPPQISGISRFANINGTIYGHSNLNPMIYQIWDTDQWHDDSATGDPLPYQCVMAIAYGHTPVKDRYQRSNSGKFDKVYYEGYISRGTPLYANIYMDYQGNSSIQSQTINAPKTPTSSAKNVKLFTYQNAIAIGDKILGDNPIGDGIAPSPAEQDYLPKFRAIRRLPKTQNVYEYSIEIYSYDLDARWEIMTAGTNMVVSTELSKELL